jgi:hypothetical protein
MKPQNLHAILTLNGIDADHWRLAGEFNRRDNGIEFLAIEIAFKLLERLPFFDEHQSLAFIKVRIEAGVHASGCHSRWAEHRA